MLTALLVTGQHAQARGESRVRSPVRPARRVRGARFPLQTHADLVRALFLAAFEADEPFPRSWQRP
jgi:hypothetical protein